MLYSRSAASVLVCAALTVLSHAQAATHTFTDDFSLSDAVMTEVPKSETGSSSPFYVAVQNQADHDIQASISSTTVDWTLEQSKNLSAYAFRLGNPNAQTPTRVSSATLSDNTFRLNLLKSETEDALSVELAYVHGSNDARISATGNTLVVSGKESPNLAIANLIDTYFDGNDTSAYYADNTLEVNGIGTMNRIVGIEHLSLENSSINLLNNAFRIANVDSIGWIYGASATVDKDSSLAAQDNRLEITNLANATSSLVGVRISNGAMNGSNISVSASDNSLTVQNAGTISQAKAVLVDLSSNARVQVDNNTTEIFGAASTTSLYAADIDVGSESLVHAQGNILRATDLQSANNLYGIYIDASRRSVITASDNSLLIEKAGTMKSAQAAYIELGYAGQVQADGNTAEILGVSSISSLYAVKILADEESSVQAQGNRLVADDLRMYNDSLAEDSLATVHVSGGNASNSAISVAACGNSLLLQNSTLQNSAAQAVYVTLGDAAQVQVDGNTAEFLNVMPSSAYFHAASISVGAASVVQAQGNVLEVRDAQSSITGVSAVSASVSDETRITFADNAVVVSGGEFLEEGYAVELNSEPGTSASVTAAATGNSLAVYDTNMLGNGAAVSIMTDKGSVKARDNRVLISNVDTVAGLLEGVSIEARELDAEILGNAFAAENIGTATRILAVNVRANDKADLTVSDNTTRLSNIKSLDSFAGVYTNVGSNSTLVVDNNVSSLENIDSAGDLYNVRIKSEDMESIAASYNRLILHNVTAQSAYSVYGADASQITGSNNSIELSGVNKIGKIDGFDTLVLTADRRVNADEAVLTLGDSSSASFTFSDKTIVLKGDLTNTVFMQNAGQAVTFENATVRYDSVFLTSEVKVDSLEIETGSGLSAAQSDDLFKQIKASMTANAASETLSQARLAQSAFIAQAAEFTADTLMPSASDALLASGGRTTLYATVHAGNQHYDTGSFVDLSGFHFLGGAAVQIGETILTAFVEYGSANSSQHAGTARGDASHDYVGAGFGLQRTFGSFRVDSALRAGTSSTDFTGRYETENADYDSNSLYLTAHLTGTFETALSERTNAEVYGRYTYSLIDDLDVTLSDSNSSRFEGDAIQTHALRFGARILGHLKENIQWRLGAAYEQVFDGKARGQVQGVDLATPAIDGGSGIFEAALKTKPSLNSPWSFDFSVKGYAGAREGVAGSATILRAF